MSNDRRKLLPPLSDLIPKTKTLYFSEISVPTYQNTALCLTLASTTQNFTTLKISNIVRSQAFAAVYLNSIFFWDVTQRRLVSHRRFGTTYRSHLQESRCPRPIKTGPIRSPETSMRNKLRCVTSQKTTEFGRKYCICIFLYSALRP